MLLDVLPLAYQWWTDEECWYVNSDQETVKKHGYTVQTGFIRWQSFPQIYIQCVTWCNLQKGFMHM